MAAMKPTASSRPSGRMVVLAFGVAIAAAVALVAVALFLRSDNGSKAASPTPVVDLTGIPEDGLVLGSPQAKVALIEYADVQCPACRHYTEQLFPTVVDEYVRPGKVKTEFRGYPFIGDQSLTAERFLLAAAKQNKLWQLVEALYRNQGAENSGWITDQLVRDLATAIPGLDVAKLFSDAESSQIGQAAQQSAAAAQNAGVTGTPTLLVKIGDQTPYLIRVATPDQVRAALDDALQG